MTIEEQLAHLNKVTWIAMTAPDVTEKSLNINISRTLNELRVDGWLIEFGNFECNYTIGELRTIEKVLAWVTQIYYAKDKLERAGFFLEEEIDTEMFEFLVEAAQEGLIKYRKLHPDAIPFFKITAWNQITLKICPYWIFEELLLYKTGLLINNTEETFD